MQLPEHIISEAVKHNINLRVEKSNDSKHEARELIVICKIAMKDILKRFRTEPQNVNPKLIEYLYKLFGELIGALEDIPQYVQAKLIEEEIVTSVDKLVQTMDLVLGELRNLHLTFPIKVSAIEEGDRNKLKEFNADFSSCIKHLSNAIKIIKISK